MPAIVSDSLAAIAWIGSAYMIAAAWLAGRWRAPAAPPALVDPPSVTMLKPLHGAVPGLAAKLSGFLAQDYPARFDMVCGVADAADPAAALARTLAGPRLATIEVIVDPRRHGANGKVSNLVNMNGHATGALLVLSDDDMAVPPDYLRRVAAALAEPGVGCVTCLYAGRGEAGFWSRIAAAGVSWQFLPGVMIGLASGLAKPCMGSTIALSAETLARIGGFARFADALADDHAIGAAVRALGLRVAVPQMILVHGSSERGLAALTAHELRWNVTVRGLDPIGFAGSAVTFPLAWGLAAAACGAGWLPAIAALVSRVVLALRIDALARARTAPLWTLPLRDLLGAALFVLSFLRRSVDWRGRRLSLSGDGRIAAEAEWDR